MDKLLDRIFKFFENKTISFSKRTSIFIISIFALISCDYFFNFSYDLHLNNKIEKVESINNLKKIYKSDSLKLVELTELENRIFNRTHYSDRLRNLDLNQINIFKKSDKTEIINPVIKNDNTTINKPIRTLLLMTLSSSFVLLITFIVLLFMPVYDSNFRKGNGLEGWFASLILLSLLIIVIIWVAYQIPLIYNKPYLNYILNSLIHLFFTYILIKISSKN